GARVPGGRGQGLRIRHRHQPVPRFQDARTCDRIRIAYRSRADDGRTVPRAHLRRDHRRTGGGAGIAACCNLRVGTKTTRIGFPIARTLGNCLSMTSVSGLTALIGPARVKDLIFTARLIGAEEAASVGLLTEVVEDVSALQRRVDELAMLIAGNAPLTLNATKQALARLQRWLSREEGEDFILMCYMSRDFREGLDAFLNKR